MQITNVRIKITNTPLSNSSTLLGTASVQFDNCLVVHDIKLVQTKTKRIVRFPNKKLTHYRLNNEHNGYDENYGYTDIVHPSNQEFRDYIEKELFKIYEEEINNK